MTRAKTKAKRKTRPDFPNDNATQPFSATTNPNPSSGTSTHPPNHVNINDTMVPISDKALSMLNHMLGSRGLMQRDPKSGAIDVVLNTELFPNLNLPFPSMEVPGTIPGAFPIGTGMTPGSQEDIKQILSRVASGALEGLYGNGKYPNLDELLKLPLFEPAESSFPPPPNGNGKSQPKPNGNSPSSSKPTASSRPTFPSLVDRGTILPTLTSAPPGFVPPPGTRVMEPPPNGFTYMGSIGDIPSSSKMPTGLQAQRDGQCSVPGCGCQRSGEGSSGGEAEDGEEDEDEFGEGEYEESIYLTDELDDDEDEEFEYDDDEELDGELADEGMYDEDDGQLSHGPEDGAYDDEDGEGEGEYRCEHHQHQHDHHQHQHHHQHPNGNHHHQHPPQGGTSAVEGGNAAGKRREPMIDLGWGQPISARELFSGKAFVHPALRGMLGPESTSPTTSAPSSPSKPTNPTTDGTHSNSQPGPSPSMTNSTSEAMRLAATLLNEAITEDMRSGKRERIDPLPAKKTGPISTDTKVQAVLISKGLPQVRRNWEDLRAEDYAHIKKVLMPVAKFAEELRTGAASLSGSCASTQSWVDQVPGVGAGGGGNVSGKGKGRADEMDQEFQDLFGWPPMSSPTDLEAVKVLGNLFHWAIEDGLKKMKEMDPRPEDVLIPPLEETLVGEVCPDEQVRALLVKRGLPQANKKWSELTNFDRNHIKKVLTPIMLRGKLATDEARAAKAKREGGTGSGMGGITQERVGKTNVALATPEHREGDDQWQAMGEPVLISFGPPPDPSELEENEELREAIKKYGPVREVSGRNTVYNSQEEFEEARRRGVIEADAIPYRPGAEPPKRAPTRLNKEQFERWKNNPRGVVADVGCSCPECGAADHIQKPVRVRDDPMYTGTTGEGDDAEYSEGEYSGGEDDDSVEGMGTVSSKSDKKKKKKNKKKKKKNKTGTAAGMPGTAYPLSADVQAAEVERYNRSVTEMEEIKKRLLALQPGDFEGLTAIMGEKVSSEQAAALRKASPDDMRKFEELFMTKAGDLMAKFLAGTRSLDAPDTEKMDIARDKIREAFSKFLAKTGTDGKFRSIDQITEDLAKKSPAHCSIANFLCPHKKYTWPPANYVRTTTGEWVDPDTDFKALAKMFAKYLPDVKEAAKTDPNLGKDDKKDNVADFLAFMDKYLPADQTRPLDQQGFAPAVEPSEPLPAEGTPTKAKKKKNKKKKKGGANAEAEVPEADEDEGEEEDQPVSSIDDSHNPPTTRGPIDLFKAAEAAIQEKHVLQDKIRENQAREKDLEDELREQQEMMGKLREQRESQQREQAVAAAYAQAQAAVEAQAQAQRQRAAEAEAPAQAQLMQKTSSTEGEVNGGATGGGEGGKKKNKKKKKKNKGGGGGAATAEDQAGENEVEDVLDEGEQVEEVQRVPFENDPERLDAACNELFDWIKAVVWSAEQHAIKTARKRAASNANANSTNAVDPNSDAPAPAQMGGITWTPKKAPDEDKLRGMLRSVGVEVEPA